MSSEALKVHVHPRLRDARMVLGFSGWMDGGEVSTASVRWLIERLGAARLAHIEPRDFYIVSFPGSMEVSALFRPYTKIADGRILDCRFPANEFYVSEEHNLILFQGKEPNLRWEDYADCIFALAGEFGVVSIYFCGSVAGLVPHTRDPRLSCSASDEAARQEIARYGVRFSDYEGPASIVTYLTSLAPSKGVRMTSLVAEIPAYIQGRNPRCIEFVVRRLAAILNLNIRLDDLRIVSDDFERRLNKLVAKRTELAELIGKLESDYDNEVFDTQMGDLKDWLHKQGIRLD